MHTWTLFVRQKYTTWKVWGIECEGKFIPLHCTIPVVQIPPISSDQWSETDFWWRSHFSYKKLLHIVNVYFFTSNVNNKIKPKQLSHKDEEYWWGCNLAFENLHWLEKWKWLLKLTVIKQPSTTINKVLF